jgi:hypothetical protein
MKSTIYIIIVLVLTLVMGLFIMYLAGCKKKDSYNPNDLAYKFIPPAPKEWTDQFGDTERTRLIHSISELRIVVANQSRHILALEKKIDPNAKEKP